MPAGPGRPAPRVRVAFLDHHEPSPESVGAGLRAEGDEAPPIVVPLLLTRAFHARTDVPAAVRALSLAAGRDDVLTAAPIGPDPSIGEGLLELLAGAGAAGVPGVTGDAGRPGGDPREDGAAAGPVLVLLGGAGDTGAVDGLVAAIRASSPVLAHSAFATLGGHLPFDAAADRVLLDGRMAPIAVTAVVADGILRDRMVAGCAGRGIRLAPGTLAATVALARLVLRRAGEAEAGTH